MTGAAVRNGLARAGLVAGGFTLAAVVLGGAALPGPVRAVGMLALPCGCFAVLRRLDRRLARAAEGIGARPLRPALRHFLLGKRRQLHKTLHR
jgi:hypothetical protein